MIFYNLKLSCVLWRRWDIVKRWTQEIMGKMSYDNWEGGDFCKQVYLGEVCLSHSNVIFPSFKAFFYRITLLLPNDCEFYNYLEALLSLGSCQLAHPSSLSDLDQYNVLSNVC